MAALFVWAPDLQIRVHPGTGQGTMDEEFLFRDGRVFNQKIGLA